ncbi:MAG: methyltransferase domain-containing protein [Phycisphaeraceae bacterium]|nr:methyltransferase domain-containing protein [Phycisphaeraceae bacterium]
MTRRLTPELMDAPDVDRDQLGRALAYIRWVNRRLGGTRALVAPLSRWARRWPSDRPITMLDVGTGSADLPVVAARWARRNGHDLRITAIDLHDGTLGHARAFVERNTDVRDAITLELADALSLRERFADGSFDVVHAGLFLHHLPEEGVVRVLTAMDHIARAGVIWNDLCRSLAAKAAVRLLTLSASRMIRHDARVSVEAGFTRHEAIELARRAWRRTPEYTLSVRYQRFTVVGHTPGGWA